MGPRKHVLDGVQILMGRDNFEGGEGAAHKSIATLCAKTAEPIEMPFGVRTRVSPRNHVLDGDLDRPMPMGNF